MKKLIAFTVLFIFATTSMVAKKLFVEMEYESMNNTITLDYGTNKKAQTVKGDNGKALKFISLVSALNYMSLQGWEFVQIKSELKGNGYLSQYGGASSTYTTAHYIFCKEVSDEELKDVVEKSFRED